VFFRIGVTLRGYIIVLFVLILLGMPIVSNISILRVTDTKDKLVRLYIVIGGSKVC
jgi:hypothetical protein